MLQKFSSKYIPLVTWTQIHRLILPLRMHCWRKLQKPLLASGTSSYPSSAPFCWCFQTFCKLKPKSVLCGTIIYQSCSLKTALKVWQAQNNLGLGKLEETYFVCYRINSQIPTSLYIRRAKCEVEIYSGQYKMRPPTLLPVSGVSVRFSSLWPNTSFTPLRRKASFWLPVLEVCSWLAGSEAWTSWPKGMQEESCSPQIHSPRACPRDSLQLHPTF